MDAKRRYPGGSPTYKVTSNALVSSGTAGSTTVSLGLLFHPATVVKTDRLIEIGVSWAGGVGGDPVMLKVGRLTVANGTGGTAITGTGIGKSDPGDPDSADTFRVGATGGLTRGAVINGAAISLASPGEKIFFFEHTALDNKADMLRSSQDEGIEIFIVTGTAGPGTAAQFFVHAMWVTE